MKEKKKKMSQKMIKHCNCFNHPWLVVRCLFGDQSIANVFNLNEIGFEIISNVAKEVMKKDECKSVLVRLRIEQDQKTLYSICFSCLIEKLSTKNFQIVSEEVFN